MGIQPMIAANLGEKENRIANPAAIRTTSGSYTFVSASTPVFSPYVVLAGAPKSAAMIVARPSPRSVRWSPGSLMKFFPTVEDMAETSPICSTIVASAMGMIVITEVISRDASPSDSAQKAVWFQWMGSPIQPASFTAVKSTRPMTAAST